MERTGIHTHTLTGEILRRRKAWSLEPSASEVLIFWTPVEREDRGARESKEKRTWPKLRETRNSIRAKNLLTLNISRRRFYKLQAKIN